MDLLMLGIARFRQGEYDQALFYFEQIEHEKLTRFEEPYYATSYAHLLCRIGRHAEATEVLRRSPRRRWSKEHIEWADKLLAAAEEPEPPPVSGLVQRRRVLH